MCPACRLTTPPRVPSRFDLLVVIRNPAQPGAFVSIYQNALFPDTYLTRGRRTSTPLATRARHTRSNELVHTTRFNAPLVPPTSSRRYLHCIILTSFLQIPFTTFTPQLFYRAKRVLLLNKCLMFNYLFQRNCALDEDTLSNLVILTLKPSVKQVPRTV